MKSNYLTTFIIKALKATAGLMIFASGVYMVIQANEGAPPWDVLNLGIVGKTGIIYGNVSITVSAILILIDVFILKEKIGWGTILDAVVVGKTVDLLYFLNPIPLMQGSLILKLAVMLIGFIFEAFGQFVYMREGLSFGPRDTLQVGLGKLMPKLSIGFVNTIILAVALALGWLLSGPVGIASVLAPFGIGMAQNLVFKIMKFEPKSVCNESFSQSWEKLSGGRT